MHTNEAKPNRNRSLRDSTPYLYASYEIGSLAGYVAVIDPNDDRIIARISVGLRPGPMCMNPSQTKLFVLNTSSDSVSIIDIRTNKVTATINVSNGTFTRADPKAILAAPYNDKVYVANYSHQNVAIINSLTNKKIKNVDVGPGKPFAFASNANNSSYIFVACRVDDNKDYVVAISIADDSVKRLDIKSELTFDEEHNPLTIQPDGHTLIVLGENGVLTYLDGETIGVSVATSLLDNTVSGIYLSGSELLLCTQEIPKNTLNEITNLAVDMTGKITYDANNFTRCYKGQDLIRSSPGQAYVGVTIQATTLPTAGLAIYEGQLFIYPNFIPLNFVGDLEFYSDWKAYVGEQSSIRPIDVFNVSALPSIDLKYNASDRLTVKNLLASYRDQS